MKKYLYFCFITGMIAILSSCSEESDPAFDQNNFTKIYDNNSFPAAFYPIGIQQTEDDGYLILARTKEKVDGFDSNTIPPYIDPYGPFFGIYLIKTDKTGEFEKEIYIDPQYVNPIGNFMNLNGTYSFICMDQFTFDAQIITLDGNGENLTFTPIGGLRYPTSAALDNTNFLVSSFDDGSKESVISIVNPTGSIMSSKGFSIGVGEDLEDPIINHFFSAGRKFPFRVGKTGSTYYFNGIYNYTFSLVFTDLNADDPQGVVNGNNIDGGFSAVEVINGNKFATGRFNYGVNFTLPNVTLNTTGITSSAGLGGNSFLELEPNATMEILRATTTTKNALVYVSNTRSKQIGLFFYDESSGEFLSSRYLGFGNPYEVGNLIQTNDGGLAICGTTYLAGRFPRICLFKLSKEEFEGQL